MQVPLSHLKPGEHGGLHPSVAATGCATGAGAGSGLGCGVLVIDWLSEFSTHVQPDSRSHDSTYVACWPHACTPRVRESIFVIWICCSGHLRS